MPDFRVKSWAAATPEVLQEISVRHLALGWYVFLLSSAYVPDASGD
jgi:hypothetical protein